MKEVKKLYKDWAKDYESDSESNIAILTGEKLILPMLKPKKTDNILDIGCGTGRVTRLLAKKTKKVTGVDFSEQMLEVAKEKSKSQKNITYKKVNASDKLPFKDNSFDKVTAILMFNHIKDNKKLLKEIYRILKKGGTFLFDDFTCNFDEPLKLKRQNLIVRRTKEKKGIIFGRDLQNHVNSVHETGFEIKDVKFTTMDKSVEPYLLKSSYKKNKGKTLETFLLCQKPL